MATAQTSTNPPKSHSWLDRVHALLRLLLAVALLGKLVIELFAASWWMLDRMIHFQVQMFFGLLLLDGVLVMFGLLRRRLVVADKALVLLSGAMLLWTGADLLARTPAQARLVPPGNCSSAPAAGSMRLLAVNVNQNNRDFASLLQLVNRESPDVVLILELGTAWTVALAPLGDAYPVNYVKPADNAFGMGVWTRVPTEHGRFLDPIGDPVVLDLAFEVPGSEPGRRARLLGVHPPPPTNEQLHTLRNRTLEWIAQDLQKAPGGSAEAPTIVAGDFNASRFSPHFLQLCRAGMLYDAAAGQGIWRTWPYANRPTWLYGICIDHVLISRHWRVKAMRTGPEIGSDHLPLIADLELVEDN